MPLEVGYSAERLARVRARAIREAASRPEKTSLPGGEGHLEYRFPIEACLNALQSGEELHPDYLRDMAKLYPEGKVKYRAIKVRMGWKGGHRKRGKLTQYGRVTFHKTYG
jgi:hypothetical protein